MGGKIKLDDVVVGVVRVTVVLAERCLTMVVVEEHH